MSAGVSRTGSEVSRTGISWTGSAVSRPGSEVSYVDGQSIVPFVHRATSAEHEHESAKRQRTLPFGLRLDKWRAVPQQPTHAPINRRPKRGAGPPYRTSEDSDPLKLGSEHDSSVGGAWRVQDFDEAQTSEPGVSKGPTTATPASEQSITAVSELPGTRPLALQALVHKLRVLSPPLGSPFVHSPGKSPASPMKKPGLLSLIVAATKGRGDVHLPKKDKQDTEWVMERMVQLLDNQDNILSHGFNETDAKMLGKVI